MSFQYPPRDPNSSEQQTPAAPVVPPQPASAPPPANAYAVRIPGGTPYVTYGLLAVTIAVYLLQMLSKQIYGFDAVALLGMKNNAAIAAGEWWRLITPMFLHGSIFHIGFNMYALYVLGPGLERFYGKWSYLMLYLVAGVAGNVFSYMFSTYNSLGASTAIFGLLAAEGVFLYQHRDLFGESARRSLLNVIFIAVINFVIGLSPGIDNWGHLGGFVGGILYAWFAGPKMQITGKPPNLLLKNMRPLLISALVAVLDLMLFIALAMILGGAGR
jgi:rhomboid protease GluP